MSLIVQYMFGRNFYAIWEFYREEEAFCLGHIACFGLLNILSLFTQLYQHQAHAVNHQPTKCRTADFQNRRNGTSRGNVTFSNQLLQLASTSMFSIDNYMYEKTKWKKKIKKNFFFGSLFWTMAKPRTLVTGPQHDVFLTFFDTGFALLYSITYGVLHSDVIFWKKITQV